MTTVSASKALFIKLGEGGDWEGECIRNATLKFGYHYVSHELCMCGDWDAVRKIVLEKSRDQGAATRHVNQIKQFYEADETILWITFQSDRLWWCHSSREVSQLSDLTKARPAINGWSDKDVNGRLLLKNTLSGKLTGMQGFQGTICAVSEIDYLLHKINGTVEPHVAEAQEAYQRLEAALVPIIRTLHPKDLETLTDLIFRQSGWQRVGVAGGIEKDIDLDLISPVTDERIAVQVKSKATIAVWNSYREKFSDMRGFKRFYFVTHSPDGEIRREAQSLGMDSNYVLWDVEKLATQVVRGGLTGWLIDKAS